MTAVQYVKLDKQLMSLILQFVDITFHVFIWLTAAWDTCHIICVRLVIYDNSQVKPTPAVAHVCKDSQSQWMNDTHLTIITSSFRSSQPLLAVFVSGLSLLRCHGDGSVVDVQASNVSRSYAINPKKTSHHLINLKVASTIWKIN